MCECVQLDGLLAGLTAAKLPKNVFSTFIDNLISEAEQFSTFTQDQLQGFSACVLAWRYLWHLAETFALTHHLAADFSALGALTMDTPITAFLSELQQNNPRNLSDVSSLCTVDVPCVAIQGKPWPCAHNSLCAD